MFTVSARQKRPTGADQGQKVSRCLCDRITETLSRQIGIDSPLCRGHSSGKIAVSDGLVSLATEPSAGQPFVVENDGVSANAEISRRDRQGVDASPLKGPLQARRPRPEEANQLIQAPFNSASPRTERCVAPTQIMALGACDVREVVDGEALSPLWMMKSPANPPPSSIKAALDRFERTGRSFGTGPAGPAGPTGNTGLGR